MNTTSIKLGSLFDGSGAALLAASRSGIKPMWASEVAPFPVQVTHYHFPTVYHIGDVSAVSGRNITPVDVVVFGSPCQGLSIAGKKLGLADPRSTLFREAIRIIEEMQEATNGTYPKIVIWENVPGALSTNNGDDFRVVLEQLCRLSGRKVSIPKPRRGWQRVGAIMDDGFSLAWRCIDARGFGVPQQRRRIYLVADLAGQRAGEILFNPGSLSRDSETSRPEATNPADDSACCVRSDGSQITQYLFENHSQDTRYKGPLTYSPMLPAQLGTGGNNTPFVVETTPVYCMAHGQAHAEVMADTQPTLNCNHEQPIVAYDSRVRRLTPTECARLQGFPDDWCNIPKLESMDDTEYRFWVDVRQTDEAMRGITPKSYTPEQMVRWYNRLHSDTVEYKMWGNGMALPCIQYVIDNVRAVLDKSQ